MKGLLLLCLLIAGVALTEGLRKRPSRRRGQCERLKFGCERGRRKITTYCAWNKESNEFETVEKPFACMMHAIRCTKNKLEKPLHKGACGNCSESNVCKMKPGMMLGDVNEKGYGGRWRRDHHGNKGGKRRGRGICGADGNKYDNMCKFAVARCEAYNNDNTILLPESCKKQAWCKKLAGICNNGTSRHNVTYCAWNANNNDYETVTNGGACFMHCVKCMKEGMKHPLHKGVCGNCTKENVCPKMPKRMQKLQEEVSAMMEMNADGGDDNNDEGDNDGNMTVRGGGRGRKGGKRGRPNQGRRGKQGGRGKNGGRRGRKICDDEGNVYNNMCDFAVARCQKYADDQTELKPVKCMPPSMY